MKFKDEILEEKICKECGIIVDDHYNPETVEEHVLSTGHKIFLIRPYFKRVYE